MDKAETTLAAGDRNVKLRWSLLVGIVLALILVPFAIFGARMDTWTETFIASSTGHPAIVASVLGGLLASDILLPVPSSVVSTACGYLLGFLAGAFTSWAGMCVSCLLGYALASGAGRPLALRLVGGDEMGRLDTLGRRYGDWVIVITRPIPVLAEAGVVFAGIGRMPFRRFILLSTLANAGVSLAYAALGSLSATLQSLPCALAASVLLPALFMLTARVLYPRVDEP